MSVCCCFDEFPKQRVGAIGPGLEFRMELHADVKRVTGELHRFDQPVVRRGARENHAMLAKNIPVAVVEFIAVAVAFLHFGASVSLLQEVPG